MKNIIFDLLWQDGKRPVFVPLTSTSKGLTPLLLSVSFALNPSRSLSSSSFASLAGRGMLGRTIPVR
uniref:Uncharacterized protein n=1 Tax=Anguilla anguilla TaxID=7936 RepID=A0A0E9Q9J8_ANGAN